jgi:O-methyltransferase
MTDEREAAFTHALDYLGCNSIAGDVVELGVFRGESLSLLCQLVAERRMPRTVIGVDSFRGLPAPSEHDTAQFAEGGLCAGWDSAHGMTTLWKPRLVSGWFRDLPAFTDPIAFVHLDCDLYESARDGLALVTDALVDGAVVCVDDYFCHRGDPNLGVRRAWREWLDTRPVRPSASREATEFARYGWHGKAFVVHR